MGVESAATGDNSTALGNHSRASGANSTAIGILSAATGADAIALGNQSFASGVSATAIGVQARATGADSTAIGNQSRATADNSIAIGTGSVADMANTVSFGAPGAERRLTNIADGIAPTDAATIRQLNQLRRSVSQRMANLMKKFRETMAARMKQTATMAARGGPSAAAAMARAGHAAPSNAAKPASTRKAGNDTRLAAAHKTGALGGHATSGGAPAASSTAVARNVKTGGHGAPSGGPETAASDTKNGSYDTPGHGRPDSSGGGRGTPPVDGVSNAQFQSGMASVNSRIDDLDQQTRRGIAATAALAPTMMPTRPGGTTVSFNSGFYQGETGLSVGIAHRFELSMPTVVYGSYANAGGAAHVGRVGVALEF